MGTSRTSNGYGMNSMPGGSPWMRGGVMPSPQPQMTGTLTPQPPTGTVTPQPPGQPIGDAGMPMGGTTNPVGPTMSTGGAAGFDERTGSPQNSSQPDFALPGQITQPTGLSPALGPFISRLSPQLQQLLQQQMHAPQLQTPHLPFAGGATPFGMPWAASLMRQTN